MDMVRHRLTDIVSWKGRGWLGSIGVRTGEGREVTVHRVESRSRRLGVLGCSGGFGSSEGEACTVLVL